MFKDFKIQNIVGSCDVKFPIRLEGLNYSHGPFTSVCLPCFFPPQQLSKQTLCLSALPPYFSSYPQESVIADMCLICLFCYLYSELLSSLYAGVQYEPELFPGMHFGRSLRRFPCFLQWIYVEYNDTSPATLIDWNVTSYWCASNAGLIYRMKEPKVVLLIFVSGKVVLTGAVRQRLHIRGVQSPVCLLVHCAQLATRYTGAGRETSTDCGGRCQEAGGDLRGVRVHIPSPAAVQEGRGRAHVICTGRAVHGPCTNPACEYINPTAPSLYMLDHAYYWKACIAFGTSLWPSEATLRAAWMVLPCTVETWACTMLKHMGAPCRLLLEPPRSWECLLRNCS